MILDQILLLAEFGGCRASQNGITRAYPIISLFGENDEGYMSSPAFIPSLSTFDVDQAIQVSRLMAPPVSSRSSHNESVNSTGIRAAIADDHARAS